jgi:hypothetical protein
MTDETPSALPDSDALQCEIEEVAYQVYEERLASGTPGDDITDWLEAEARVRARYNL